MCLVVETTSRVSRSRLPSTSLILWADRERSRSLSKWPGPMGADVDRCSASESLEMPRSKPPRLGRRQDLRRSRDRAAMVGQQTGTQTNSKKKIIGATVMVVVARLLFSNTKTRTNNQPDRTITIWLEVLCCKSVVLLTLLSVQRQRVVVVVAVVAVGGCWSCRRRRSDFFLSFSSIKYDETQHGSLFVSVSPAGRTTAGEVQRLQSPSMNYPPISDTRSC